MRTVARAIIIAIWLAAKSIARVARAYYAAMPPATRALAVTTENNQICAASASTSTPALARAGGNKPRAHKQTPLRAYRTAVMQRPSVPADATALTTSLHAHSQ